MFNKISANVLTMPMETLKLAYIQSFIADNAFAQLKLRLRSATKSFRMASKMLNVLTAAFGNANKKQEAKAKYCSLQQGTWDFKSFWAKFLSLSQQLNHLEATLIDDLIEKSHHSIQLQLATGDEDPTDLIQLAKRCQRIKQQLKSVDRAQFVEKQCVKKNAIWRNKKPVFNKAIVNVSVNSAAPMQANWNPAICVPQNFQPHAQVAAPPAGSMRTTIALLAAIKASHLTNKEMNRLKKLGCCYKCTDQRYMAAYCTQQKRLYLSISAALQEATVRSCEKPLIILSSLLPGDLFTNKSLVLSCKLDNKSEIKTCW